MRGVLALGLLAACGDQEVIAHGDAGGTACRIEAVVDRIADPTAMSCNPTASDEAAQRAAHDCIVRANGMQMPFSAIYELAGGGSRVARAYVGRDESGMFRVSSVLYDGDPSGATSEGDPHAETLSCETLTDLGPCAAQDLAMTLCLQCDASTIVDMCPG